MADTYNLDFNINKRDLAQFSELARRIGVEMGLWEGESEDGLVSCTFTGPAHHLVTVAEYSHTLYPSPLGFSLASVRASLY